MFRAFTLIFVLAVLLGGCPAKYQTKDDLLKEGMNLLANGNPGGAIVLLKNALDKDQKFLEARLQLAQAYSSAGKFEAADRWPGRPSRRPSPRRRRWRSPRRTLPTR